MRLIRLAARRSAAGLLGLLAAAAPAAAAVPFEAPSGLVIVPAVVDGHPLRLLLDTGDPGGLSLEEAAARRLGLAIEAPDPAGAARALAGSLPAAHGMARVGRLAVDDARWSGLRATIAADGAALREAIGGAYDGVIGASLLVHRRLVVDYPARRLSLERATAPAPAADRSGRLVLAGGRLLTEIEAGGRRGPALIDTGSAVTMLDPGAMDAPDTGRAPRVGVVDASGRAGGLPSTRLDRLLAGGALLRDVPVLLLALDDRTAAGAPPGGAPIAILGADVLSLHRVVLDTGAGTFVMEVHGP